MVEVAGVALSELRTTARYTHRRRHIGFVFQELNLLRTLTAVENVALPAELDGVPRKKALAAAREALRRVGIDHLANRLPVAMSGGQQQRVAIARALGCSGKILLADEPTGALDSATATEILDVITSHVRDAAAGVIVTHDPRVAARANRILYMRDGQLTDSPGTGEL